MEELPVSPAWLPGVLEKETFLHWHAFFVKYFHNHKTQGAISLARIGATEDRVKARCEFANKTTGILSFAEEPNLKLEIEVDSLKSKDIADYLGSDVGYYRILDHFTKLFESKYQKDIKAFIRNEVPAVVDGQLGSLFHGIIQTGYGLAGNCHQVVLEGVALSFHQYNQVTSEADPERARDLSLFGTGTTDIIDVLNEVMKARAQGFKENPDAWKNGTSIAKNYGDVFLKLTDEIRLPVKIDRSFRDHNQAVSLMDWVLDMATVIYLQSDYVNDFFLLHGVTGAWSLLQVISLLDCKTALVAIRAHLTGLLITYARVNPPGLSKKPGDYWEGEAVDEAAWRKILNKLIENDYEAHIHKICQCLYEAWKKNPKSSFAKYHIAASTLALNQKSFHHKR